MSEPRFSIVIPTRNRAGLLRLALATTVRQRFRDLEVVVSDNWSEDETRRVVEELDDGRVRYVRPDRALVQPDHFDFAVAQARGEWVFVYADDDGAPESFIERLAAAIGTGGPRLVCWPSCYYVHPRMVGSGENRLTVYPFTGSVRLIPCRDELKRVFARREDRNFPKLGANVAVRRDLLDEVRKHAGRLFQPPFSDYTFGPVALALEPDYLFIDQPLTMSGIAATSIGLALVRRDEPGRAFLQELGAGDVLRSVPLPFLTLENLIAESVLRAKALAPHLFEDLELDPAGYLLSCYRDLGNGAVCEEDVAAWRALVRSSPPAVRAAVARGIVASRARRAVGDARVFCAQRLRGAAALWRAARRRVTARTDFLHVTSETSGFTNIVGAARYLEEDVLGQVPFPQTVNDARPVASAPVQA